MSQEGDVQKRSGLSAASLVVSAALLLTVPAIVHAEGKSIAGATPRHLRAAGVR